MNGIFAKIIAVFAIGFVFALLITLPVMWLWNGVMPEMFSMKEIDLWMAFKISLLSMILFKSSGSSSKD
jgi:hypothetical protein